MITQLAINLNTCFYLLSVDILKQIWFKYLLVKKWVCELLEAKLKGFYNEQVKRVLETRRIAITFVQTLKGDTMTYVCF